MARTQPKPAGHPTLERLRTWTQPRRRPIGASVRAAALGGAQLGGAGPVCTGRSWERETTSVGLRLGPTNLALTGAGPTTQTGQGPKPPRGRQSLCSVEQRNQRDTSEDAGVAYTPALATKTTRSEEQRTATESCPELRQTSHQHGVTSCHEGSSTKSHKARKSQQNGRSQQRHRVINRIKWKVPSQYPRCRQTLGHVGTANIPQNVSCVE